MSGDPVCQQALEESCRVVVVNEIISVEVFTKVVFKSFWYVCFGSLVSIMLFKDPGTIGKFRAAA